MFVVFTTVSTVLCGTQIAMIVGREMKWIVAQARKSATG
jgi:hypothetical protein